MDLTVLMILALSLISSPSQQCRGIHAPDGTTLPANSHTRTISQRGSIVRSVSEFAGAGRDGGVGRPDSDVSDGVMNVNDYGAQGDGCTDDTEAFANAWKAACSSSSAATLIVPKDQTYLLKPIAFSGPCTSPITVMIKGTLLTSSEPSDWSKKMRKRWIVFSGIHNLEIQGGGIINGNGQSWWKSSCKFDNSQPCTDAPTAFTFQSCKGLNVCHLNFKNSPKMHVTFEHCTDVQVSSLVINAPESSPNTDGIHLSGSKNIWIDNCSIQTGDDCISIVSGSQYVNATNISCGPGHGISIGSLGKDGATARVSDILVDTAQLKGTMNGVRIKTWKGGKGYVKSITFKNIRLKNVKNPIIIGQNYYASTNSFLEQKSGVAINNVTYKNITGTSATPVVIVFDCSKGVPCQGIRLQDINLTLAGEGTMKSICNNVSFTKHGIVIPTPCT